MPMVHELLRLRRNPDYLASQMEFNHRQRQQLQMGVSILQVERIGTRACVIEVGRIWVNEGPMRQFGQFPHNEQLQSGAQSDVGGLAEQALAAAAQKDARG